jgi:hypothetical protein
MRNSLPGAHGVSIRASSIHGDGVFAARAFSPGEMVIRIDDSWLVDSAHPLRPDKGELAHHFNYLAGGKMVLMAPSERYINSSCDPNSFVRTVDGARHVIAKRLIAPGEEITYDYIINCHGGAVWACNCGSERCRGTIVSSFFELPLERQLEYLPLLDCWFADEHRDAVRSIGSTTAAVE